MTEATLANDPIPEEIIQNAMQAVAGEMFAAMKKTACAPTTAS
jgi:N-methylhydantoinase B/oxoprolinase/acetone carboxylase alpha subunit